MAEPAKKKQRFDAQAHSALQGMRIVPPAARPDGGKDGSPGSSPTQSGAHAPETNLVEKLIDFFKTME